MISRAVWVQIVGDARLARMAKRQFDSKYLLRPRRGVIADRNSEPLAVNLEVKSLAVNPQKITNAKTLTRLLARALDLPAAKIAEKLASKREFAWLKRHLSEHELNRLTKAGVLDSSGDLIQGLWMVRENKRVYPHGELAAQILGDVDLDSEGLEGVELWQNQKLRGSNISVSGTKDALGRPTFLDTEAAKNLKDGDKIDLTLDSTLQFSVEQSLRQSIARTGSRAGTVMVMDSMSGEMLAIANYPGFDPNRKDSLVTSRRNRAVTDGYEPGSTVKPLLLAIAFQNGSKLTDQIYAEEGSFSVQGKKISEAEAHEKFGWITLKKLIQVSSNVGAAKLALKLGADKFYNGLVAFGLGGRSGLGFPGEIQGRIQPKKKWTPLTTANIGFGQGILVTPIQMLRAYAALSNGGFLVEPSLLRNSQEAEQKNPPKRILSTKTVQGVTEALLTVTTMGGTGVKASVDGYDIAGKTGTAQMVDPSSGKYSRSHYNASFIGYPVGTSEKVVIFVSLDSPRGVYYASETAAPLFREVFQAVATRLSMPAKQLPELTQQKTDETEPVTDRIRWSLAKSLNSSSQLQWESSTKEGKSYWKMPLLKGLSVREAFLLFRGHNFSFQVQGQGLVRTQIPEPGTKVSEGQTVRLQLSSP